MKKTFIASLLVLAFLVNGLGLVSAQEPIRIGLQAPITGEYAYEGEGFVKVLELAVEMANAAGGLLGRPVEIVKCDDVGKPDESSKCATKLVSEGVDAVIGSYSSTCTEPASEIYNEAGILQITPSSTATRLSQKGFQRFFRVCFLDDRQGLFAANFMKDDLGAQKVAIMHDNSTYAQGLAEHTERYAREAGLEVVFMDAINPEDTDFTPTLTKVKEIGPDALYFTGYHPQGGLLLKQAKDLGAEFAFVMGNACNNPELVDIAGVDAAAGAFFTTEPLPKDIEYPEAQAFVEAFSEKYGEELSSIWWLMVADAFNVIADAIEATGGTDAEAMAAYLHTEFADYPGVTGPILGYDENGDRLGTVHIAYIINEDGSFSPYVAMPSEPAGEPIRIGLQAPITGEYAYEGEGFVKVLELAVEMANAAGGLLGRPVEIVKCDDVGKPDESSKCATKLVSEGVDAVIGSYSSTCTEPASEIYNEAGILQITPSSTATRLSQKGFQRFFRVCFLDDRQGLFAANFMKDDLGAQKVAIMHDNSTYAQGLAEHTERYAREAGLEVVFMDAINPEDTDFTPTLTKVKEIGPDALYFTGYHPQGGLLLKQAKDLGAEFAFVMGNACNNPELVDIAGVDAAAGAFFTTEPLPKDIEYPEAQAFVEAFSEKYGEELSSIWWLMVADAFNVIADAIEATGGTDAEAMAAYLHTEFADYPGVTGPILGYDENGDRLGTVHIAYIINEDGSFSPYVTE